MTAENEKSERKNSEDERIFLRFGDDVAVYGCSDFLIGVSKIRAVGIANLIPKPFESGIWLSERKITDWFIQNACAKPVEHPVGIVSQIGARSAANADFVNSGVVHKNLADSFCGVTESHCRSVGGVG